MKDEEPFKVAKRKIAFWFYAFLAILGVIFYLAWGVFFGTWNILQAENLGVYAIFIILVGFGILGMLLYHKE